MASLEHALQEPVGYFGSTVSEEDRAQWRSEQLVVLDHLADLTARTADPLIHLRIVEALAWHVRYRREDEIRAKARQIVDGLPDSFELRLARTLIDKHTIWEAMEADAVTDRSWRSSRQQAAYRAVAAELIARYPAPADGLRHLAERLRASQAAYGRAEPGWLLGAVADVALTYAADMALSLIATPDDTLAFHLHTLLDPIRAAEPDRAAAIIRQAIESGHLALCLSIAHAYRWRSWLAEARPDDLALATRLLSHDDLAIRRLAIGSLAQLGQQHPRRAIALALTVDPGSIFALAEALFGLFEPAMDVTLDEVTDDELAALVGKLELVEHLEDYHIRTFLTGAAARQPHVVMQMLLNRITHDEQDETGRFQPLPYDGPVLDAASLATHPEYVAVLGTIRDAMLRDTWQARWWIPRLFRTASLNYGQAGLDVLHEWIDSGDAVRIAAASRLLKEAPTAPVGIACRQCGTISSRLRRAEWSNACWSSRRCATP
ncbi:MAG: hypothetical protein IT340_19500 [Chloroflexi bacterium]|nr:hypothetical protein [Chloroflexota bacterium]